MKSKSSRTRHGPVLQGSSLSMLWMVILLAMARVPISHAHDDADLIGKKAPKVAFESWFLNKKFEPIKKFKAGKVYVISFYWIRAPSTWDIREVAAKFSKHKNVELIVVDCRQEDEILEFFAERDRELDETRSVRTSLKDIRYFADSDLKVTKEFFGEKAKDGISKTVVIGADGKVEWADDIIGHSVEVVEQVLEKKWDREDFVSYLKNTDVVLAAIKDISSLAEKADSTEMVERAIEKYRKKFKDLKSARLRAMFSSSCFDRLVETNSRQKYVFLDIAYEASKKVADPMVVSGNTIVKQIINGDRPVDSKLLRALVKVFKKMERDHPERPDVLYVESKILYTQGRLKEAIAAYKKLRSLPMGIDYPKHQLEVWEAELENK